MKSLFASPALLLFAAAPAHAQWEPPDEVLQVRISGKGAWSVRCAFQNTKGKTTVREAKGRSEQLHLIKAVSGVCTYEAAPDKPLTIWLKSPLYQCTLPAREPKLCRQTFAAGTSGQIDIRRRD